MDRLAAICEQIASHSSRLKKTEIAAGYLRSLDDSDLPRAVRFLCCDPASAMPASSDLFGNREARKLAVGHAVLRDAAVAVTGWPVDIFRVCHRETGDIGETISLLLEGHTHAEPMTLAEAEARYRELFTARATPAKAAVLKRCFSTYPPLTIKYFVKVITGDLRVGFLCKQVEEAVAAACGVPAAKIRVANNLAGDLATVASAVRRGDLASIETRLFHPMEFMLAKPLDCAADLDDPPSYLVEDKYDGVRAQVHFSGGRVAIYSRGMEEMTGAFPEIAAAFQRLPGSAVVDGEVLGWRDGRALPFPLLQQRLARKRSVDRVAAGIPAAFMAYDMIFRDGRPLTEAPLEQRRSVLEQLAVHFEQPLLLSPVFGASSEADLDTLFEGARLRGNEGLLLKRRGSVYESGRRSGAWRKLKRPFATLDVVVTSAEQGSGRRATMLSDYTFGVRSGDEYVNVGKAYSGLTDAEVRELTRLLRSLAVQRFGRAILVRPSVVLEVAFDGIQKSSRHKGGFALRFPRILRWRRDKTAEQADSIERVRALYDSALNLTTSRE